MEFAIPLDEANKMSGLPRYLITPCRCIVIALLRQVLEQNSSVPNPWSALHSGKQNGSRTLHSGPMHFILQQVVEYILFSYKQAREKEAFFFFPLNYFSSSQMCDFVAVCCQSWLFFVRLLLLIFTIIQMFHFSPFLVYCYFVPSESSREQFSTSRMFFLLRRLLYMHVEWHQAVGVQGFQKTIRLKSSNKYLQHVD